MLFKSDDLTKTAEGIASERDLWTLADGWDVCGQCRCPLTDEELRAVFARVRPVGGPRDNRAAVMAAVLAASERAWDEGRE
jgi:hypothetical protein